jgi:hypothetical protein
MGFSVMGRISRARSGMKNKCEYTVLRSAADTRAFSGKDRSASGIVVEAVTDAEDIMREFFGEFPPSPQTAAFECLSATKLLQAYLADRGITSKILTGYVQLDREWLEHYLTLVFLPDAWVCVDFTARQIPRFAHAEYIVIVISPEWECLEQALQTEYRWWIPPV